MECSSRSESSAATALFHAAQTVIFDCDGVLVDSEPIANRVLAELISECGVPLTVAESVRLFVGRTLDGMGQVAFDLGGSRLREIILTKLWPRTLQAFQLELKAMPGLVEVVRRMPCPKAVASNSMPARLDAALEIVGLTPYFAPHIYSSAVVARPKPAPDVYLHAAARLGVDARACLVIEDTPTGCSAALDAGMTVIGFVGGGHAAKDLGGRLKSAGAAALLGKWSDIVAPTAHEHPHGA